MADIEFVISKRTGKKAEGKLKWPAKSLEANALSGEHGKGYLPNGLYDAPRNKLLDKPGEDSYCDKSSPKNCWFQVCEPTFETDRTDLGIHPDGNIVGTRGCIGITDDETKEWYDAFYSIAAGAKVTVEVKDA